MKKVLFILIFLGTVISLFPQVLNIEKANDLYSRGMANYETGHYDSLIYYLKEALTLRKNHPRILYNLAAGYALNGNKSEATDILNKIADMKLYYPVEQDSDFVSIMRSDAFNSVMKKFDDNLLPIINSTTAFNLREKGLLTEGIAYDRQTNKFFVSSVHKRKILEYQKNGKILIFNSGSDSLLGIFGMHADYKHRFLWAVGGAIKNIQDYNDNMKGESLLYQFNLDSGKLLTKFEPPEKDRDHLLGDLTLDSNGNVFVSDSRNNAIYKLTLNGKEMETFVSPGNFISLQGIALTDNDSILFAADYSQGIFKISLKDKSATLMLNKTETTLLGIDGLYCYKNDLIAIQNGVKPQRILRIVPDKARTMLYDYQVLEANNPKFDEPTLGVIVENEFYFIANSQWRRFNEDGTIFPDAELDYPLVLKIDLNAIE